MQAKGFEDLLMWQKAHAWVLAIYRLSAAFPKHELFGLTSQLRRAAVSVPANVAEGFRRSTQPDKRRFYNISQCSLEECRYYLILANDLRYGDPDEPLRLIGPLDEIARMLSAYMRTLKT
jgi:four helix bundle protein